MSKDSEKMVPDNVVQNIKKLAAEDPGLNLSTFRRRYQYSFGTSVKEEDLEHLASLRLLDLSYEEGLVVVRPRGGDTSPLHSVTPLGLKEVRREELPVQQLPSNVGPGSHFPIVVTHVDSPDQFWFNIYSPDHYDAVVELMDRMNRFYNDRGTEPYKVVKLAEVAPGSVAAARYLSEGFHRVQVLRHLEGGRVELFYSDYGTKAVQKLRNVRFLLQEFSILPGQAITGQLWGVKGRGDGNGWGEEVRARMVDLVNTVKGGLVALVKDGACLQGVLEERQALVLQLVDVVANDGLDIGNQLVEEGLAKWKDGCGVTLSDRCEEEGGVSEVSVSQSCSVLAVLSKQEIDLQSLLDQLNKEGSIEGAKRTVMELLENLRKEKINWREGMLSSGTK